MTGDNSETNKKDKFDQTIELLLLSLVDKNIDFYKKMSHKGRNRFIKERLYGEYFKSLEGGLGQYEKNNIEQ